MENKVSIDDFKNLVGKKFQSPWILIDQQRISTFAEATLDHQFIHVDPEKAKQTEFGGTIAHGLLILSLLPYCVETALPKVADVKMGLNYGYNNIRFLSPVKCNSKIRGDIEILSCTEIREGQYQTILKTVVEIEEQEKPALVAEWINLILI